MSAKHTETFEKFSATFPPETVAKWLKMVEHWEANPRAPNPYDEPESSKFSISNVFSAVSSFVATTLQDVRLELTRTETLQLASGRVPRHKVTMMGFFAMGFDIEDYQYVIVNFDYLESTNTAQDLCLNVSSRNRRERRQASSLPISRRKGAILFDRSCSGDRSNLLTRPMLPRCCR